MLASTSLDIECSNRVWNLTFDFTLNAGRHFPFINQMQCYAQQITLRKGKAVTRKPIKDMETTSFWGEPGSSYVGRSCS